jgi:hypothetical protein
MSANSQDPGKPIEACISGNVVVGNFPFQDTRHYLGIILGRHFISDDFDAFVDELRAAFKDLGHPLQSPAGFRAPYGCNPLNASSLLSRVRCEFAFPPDG